MSKIIYDVIQRFEVENHVPRLISTNIQVIRGGEDLLSIATDVLAKFGFEQRFQENRTSQYTGYRLKDPRKGAKRYQLVIGQRKEGLWISIPKEILAPFTLEITQVVREPDEFPFAEITLNRVWVRPSREDRFLEALKSSYGTVALKVLNGELAGNSFCVNPHEYDFRDRFGTVRTAVYYSHESFSPESLGPIDNYLLLNEDQLFPYAWQVTVSYAGVLREFLSSFARILIEKASP